MIHEERSSGEMCWLLKTGACSQDSGDNTSRRAKPMNHHVFYLKYFYKGISHYLSGRGVHVPSIVTLATGQRTIRMAFYQVKRFSTECNGVFY